MSRIFFGMEASGQRRELGLGLPRRPTMKECGIFLVCLGIVLAGVVVLTSTFAYSGPNPDRAQALWYTKFLTQLAECLGVSGLGLICLLVSLVRGRRGTPS